MSSQHPTTPASVSEGAVTYADGSENYLVEVMRSATDRSTASDELASRVRDWPSRYHLSRMRANLLRPLELPSRMRVLDVGAGTGALSRYLGERGCEVVALEGNPDRARAAALRCDGLANVTVVTDSLAEYSAPDGFDLVLVCGVLEYAADALGGAAGADAFLDRVRTLVRPDGSVAVAIENRLGLKYLLGYAEDHLGKPWIGVEGYPTDSAVRTYSKAVLRGMLETAGFEHQRWLYPFPDYKLPKVVLAEPAYAQPDGTDLVDQLVGKPCRDEAHAAVLLCDERRAHRSFVEAGLGPEVANSFFVVAGADPSRTDRLVPQDVLAWHFGQERKRRWGQVKIVRQLDGPHTRQVVAHPLDGGEPAAGDGGDGREVAPGWLRQSVAGETPYHVGKTLEQTVLEACGRDDATAVTVLLRAWRDHLEALSVPAPDGPRANPFQIAGTSRVLPEGYVDVNLSNFVLTGDGLVYIDAEWHIEGGADPDVVAFRAMWYLAYDLVATGIPHPWPEALSIDDLAFELARAAGVEADAGMLEFWQAAEAEFQAAVTDVDAQSDLVARELVGAEPTNSADLRRGLPLARLLDPGWPGEVEHLRRELEDLRDQFDYQRVELNRHSESLIEAQEIIERLRSDRDRLHRLTAEMTDDVERHRRALGEANDELARWRARWDSLERRWPVRLLRRLTRRPLSDRDRAPRQA